VTLSREGAQFDSKQNKAHESKDAESYNEKRKNRSSTSSFPDKEDSVFYNNLQSTKMTLANPRIRLMMVLGAVFFVCTLPVAVAFIVDASLVNFNIMAAQIATKISVHLYTLLCPLLLVKYMSNLREAVNRFFGSILFSFA